VRGNRLVPDHPDALPERFVFFPMQVRQDSQLTVHSPVYGNRLDLALDDLTAALAEKAPDMRLVVKLHPRTDARPTTTLSSAVTPMSYGLAPAMCAACCDVRAPS
jgi:hypothetical protein